MLFLKLWSILDVAVAAIVKVWSLESRVLNLLVLWRFWIMGQFWIEILWRLWWWWWWCSFVVSQKHMRGSMSVAVAASPSVHLQFRNMTFLWERFLSWSWVWILIEFPPAPPNRVRVQEVQEDAGKEHCGRERGQTGRLQPAQYPA